MREVGVDDFVRGREPMRHATAELDEETARQLRELARRGRRDGDGALLRGRRGRAAASSCQLLSGDAVAQIEDVETFPQYRNRGLARALMQRVMSEAERDGARVTFLLASEDDWPQQLYRKLGFEAAGVELIFGRPG